MTAQTRPSDHDSDAALASRVVAGEHAAFEQIMRRYNRRLYRLARATLRDPDEAQDALQDAYVHAFRAIAQYRGEAALSTWLSRLVLNECFARLRRSARRQNVVPIVASQAIDLDAVAADDRERPDEAAGRAEIRRVLEQKVDALPEAFRVVFVMRTVEEMTVEEIAEALGIPEATVRTRHFRARSLLREALARDLDLAERDVFEFGGEHCDRTVAAVMERLRSG